MLFPAFFLFFIFLVLSAFFSSSETAFIAANPIKLDYLGKKDSKRARQVRSLLKKLDNLLATILIGNTLVNTAAASMATLIFVSFMPDRKNQAVLLATIVTTLFILVFSEINPKIYAAYNPIKLSLWTVQPIRFFVILFYPLVKVFTALTRMIFPSQRTKTRTTTWSEEEIKVLLTMGIKGMTSLRKKMISGVLDIGTRPVREIMVPRPQVKAIEMDASFEKILRIVRSAEFSRFPVFEDRVDNIKGLIHAKDVIPYLIDKKKFNINEILRKAFFVPESATMESVMSQMQATSTHLVFVVDEFGNMEGIVTLEDIIEELVGEIQDEHDGRLEELVVGKENNIYIIKGSAPIKHINRRLPLGLPEKGEYTTIAGFFLDEFGQIPKENDRLEYKDSQFIVERMNKRQIDQLRIVLKSVPEKSK